MGDDPRLNQEEIDALLADIPGEGGGDAADDILADFGGGDATGGLDNMDLGGGDMDLGGGDMDLGGGDMDLGGDDFAGMMDEPAADAPAPKPARAAAAPAPAAIAQNFSGEFSQKNIEVLLDVPLEVVVELGRSEMPIQNILELGPGSIVELNRLSGEPINILVNGKLVAKGEVVVVDENFGIKITHIISPLERLTQLN